ncbi:BlaI/MecI/CopY family transcriptional regulator [Xylocopilactobacillus apis]|uniref:Penicillinase repressor n=1 Tax=Xylocopilactobacillus apis TaxID=2932183 RepID=A0AAU9DJS0_9LACO|nr:BlaI/MecI/CopY family transcriptional regulator [Xylocopilactobacillus apis]BDR55669.1 hypothetical protein KIMC2_02310 [Xylocopilactobacillus apis]
MKLTGNEEKIMHILWDSKKPLSSREISQISPSLKKTVVQTVLRKLSEKKFVKAVGITYSGSSITREFRPIVTEEEYFASLIPQDILNRVVSTFISSENDEEDIENLYKIIKDKYNSLHDLKEGKDV